MNPVDYIFCKPSRKEIYPTNVNLVKRKQPNIVNLAKAWPNQGGIGPRIAGSVYTRPRKIRNIGFELKYECTDCFPI